MESFSPTSVRRFPRAHDFSIAGDIAVWAAKDDYSVNWQLLAHSEDDRTVGKTQTLDLRNVGEGNRLAVIQDLHLNSDGFLLLRVQLGPSIYVPWGNNPSRSFRDVIYSLMDRKIFMWKDYMDVPTQETPRDTPLFIGKHRVYFARRSPDNMYDLVAFEFRTRNFLYKSRIITNIANDDHGCLRRKGNKVLELVQLNEDEFIIQFDSCRLVSWRHDSPAYFAIINGANGHVIQKISYNGFIGRHAVVTNSTTFALVGSLSEHNFYDVVTIQKFSQQSDKKFSRITRQIVNVAQGLEYRGSIIIHPFTLQGFSLLTGDSAPQALTLAQSQNTDICSRVDVMLQQLSPGITVDSYYDVVEERPLTLPPRQSNRGYSGRRRFQVVAERNYARMRLLDERRVIFDHSGSKDDAVYLFDFKPKW